MSNEYPGPSPFQPGNQPPQGQPPYGQGPQGQPPYGQPPYDQPSWSGPAGPPPPGQPQPGWAAPAGGPPKGPNTGRTLAWLAGGLVLVLLVLGGVALFMRGDSGDSDTAEDAGPSGDGTHESSCQTYLDVVASSEVWSSAGADPAALTKMYDAVLAEIDDDEIKALVTTESEAVVPYYEKLSAWRTALEDAAKNGEDPDTTMPVEMTELRSKITAAQSAVLAECSDVSVDGDDTDPDEPVPSITAPPLDRPSWMDE